MTYILLVLGTVNFIFLFLIGKIAVRNSENIRKLNQQQEAKVEKGLIEP